MTELKPHAAHWGTYDAVVRDGRVVGVRPFERDPFPGSLIESVPDIVHAACRVDRPYIRKGWLEGRRKGALRGGDPFIPVSWDRAVRLVAEETRRVRTEHGPTSMFGGSYGWSSAGRFHHARSQLQRFLGLGGGYTGQVNAYSYAAAQALLPHILGTNEVLLGRTTDWAAITRHAKVMLCLGGLPLRNGLVTSGAAGRHSNEINLREAAAAGLRFIQVSPNRADVPDWCNAEWIPIRPGTDTALLLAMAHTIVTAGREDRDYLATRCVGWDRLRAYITGETDGVAKTPEWAEPITTIPAATTRRIAMELADLPAMLTATWSLQRADYGEQPYWMLAALAAILGKIGKPGEGVAYGYGSVNGMGEPRQEVPSFSMPATRNPTGAFIPVARITDMLENPGGAYDFNGRAQTYPDTRIIWWAGGNPFHHHQDLNRMLRGWAQAETVIVQEQHWTAAARHADIILPATTTLERNDIASSGRDRFVRAMHQAIAPVGQARNDHDLLADIAEELGYRDRFTEQRNEDAWLRHLFEQWRQNCARLGFDTPDFELPARVARECFRCHATQISAGDEQRFDEETMIPNVSCERCHGPAKAHVAAARRGAAESDLALPFGQDRWTADGLLKMCGACHRLPGAAQAAQIRTDNTLLIRFQPVGIMQSACYQKSGGKFSCVTCHDPHARVSTQRVRYDATCMSCHVEGHAAIAPGSPPPHSPAASGSAAPEPGQIHAEGAPCPVSPGARCVECHMPRLDGGQGIMFSDHWIRVRRQGEAPAAPGAAVRAR